MRRNVKGKKGVVPERYFLLVLLQIVTTKTNLEMFFNVLISRIIVHGESFCVLKETNVEKLGTN